MLFAVSLAASLAALGQVAGAAAPPGTFGMRMQRDPVKHARAAAMMHKRAALARRAPFTATLGSVPYQGGGFYYVNVTVGTPPQLVQLDIDTGSSDVWMFSPEACAAYTGYGSGSDSQQQCEGGVYNISNSRTSTLIQAGAFSISYADSSKVLGDYFADQFVIGGQTINNLTMAYATTSSGVNTGIMGIGYNLSESLAASEAAQGETPTPYANLIDVMQTQGLITAKSYSLYLDDLQSSTGTILFGGYDSSRFEGELGILPIQPDSSSGTISSFTVIFNSVGVTANGKSTVITSNSAPNTAVLDSGTSITLLPQDIYDELANYLGVENTQDYGAVVRCDLNGMTGTVDYQMGSPTGPVIAVDFQELALPLLDDQGRSLTDRRGNDICLFGISAADTSSGIPILFGDTFLRSAYVIYDLDAAQIGIAQAKFDATSAAVHTVTAGAGQTISGVFVTPSTSIAMSTAQSDPFGGAGGIYPTGSVYSAITAGGFDDSSSATATGTAALRGYQTTYSNRVTQSAETYNGVKGGITGAAATSTHSGAAAAPFARSSGQLPERVVYAALGTIAMVALGAGLIL